ncbi:MAG TPA: ABC transporter permease, partial [Cyclobacteriaceae bacterium]|nr:ABC transporter permease [Cyclobacteriaceae bacterium]
MIPSPPRWPTKLLEMFCDPELVDEIEGDLLEMYQKWVLSGSTRKAKWKYVLHTIKFVRPFIFKRRGAMKNYSTSDAAHIYFKSSWRNIMRKKTFAAINVAGLALSFTCIIFIYALCTFHLRFDNFHNDSGQIYRVITATNVGSGDTWPVVPQPLGKAIREDLTATEVTARIRYYRNITVVLPESDGAPRFEENNTVAFTEPDYFRIFNYTGATEVITSQLRNPNTVVITRTMAKKYFGDAAALDQVIRVVSGDKQVDFRVVGVLDDLPPNTDLRAQVFLSYENLKDYNAYFASDKSWGSVNGGMFCFVKLKQGTTPAEMEAAFAQLVTKYYDVEDQKIYGFKLQPLADMHLDIALGGSFSWKYVWILAAIGVLLVVIAGVNFVNLASAHVLTRAREAGIRKVLGSHRFQLYLQFIIETSIIGLAALIIALGT